MLKMDLVSRDTSSTRNLVRMAGRLNTLHETGEYSDFVIECEGKELKVHKAIVCPQSGFFKRLCAPTFKEGNEGRAIIRETDPVLLEQAIRFLYTGHYSSETLEEATVCSIPDFKSSPETTQESQPKSEGTIILIEEEQTGETSQVELVEEVKEVEEVVEIGISSNGRSKFAIQEDHPALLLNIRMYILADFLEIPLLKTEALERCTDILEEEFEPARLIGPFQVALENTTSSDPELRSSIFRLCSEQRERVIACTKLDELLSREEPIAWRLLKDQDMKHSMRLRDSDLERNRLEADIVSLELQLVDVRHELEAADELVREKSDRLDDCVKLTQRWNECRNCTVDFDAELERHRHTGEYLLRCKRCRCRHEGY